MAQRMEMSFDHRETSYYSNDSSFESYSESEDSMYDEIGVGESANSPPWKFPTGSTASPSSSIAGYSKLGWSTPGSSKASGSTFTSTPSTLSPPSGISSVTTLNNQRRKPIRVAKPSKMRTQAGQSSSSIESHSSGYSTGRENKIVRRATIYRENSQITKACCVACREKEIMTEGRTEQPWNIIYENCRVVKTTDGTVLVYARLVCSTLAQFISSGNNAEADNLRRKVERILKMDTGFSLDQDQPAAVQANLNQFVSHLRLRLRAIRDVNRDAFRAMTDRLSSEVAKERRRFSERQQKGSKSTLQRIRASIRRVFKPE